jgi:hypothetical protein
MAKERKGALELFTVINYTSKKTGKSGKMLKLSGSTPNKQGKVFPNGVKQVTIELHSGETIVLDANSTLFPRTPEEKINSRAANDPNFTEDKQDAMREALKNIAAIYELPAQK